MKIVIICLSFKLGLGDIHYIAKSIGTPLLMNRIDYFSNFYEYKS